MADWLGPDIESRALVGYCMTEFSRGATFNFEDTVQARTKWAGFGRQKLRRKALGSDILPRLRLQLSQNVRSTTPPWRLPHRPVVQFIPNRGLAGLSMPETVCLLFPMSL